MKPAPATGPTLAIQGRSRFAGLPARATLARWIAAALDGAAAELTVRFVDAREGRRLNRQFRGKDHATNVLTFDYRHADPVTADLVLCVPVLVREARAQAKTPKAHLAHLLVHGVLHARGLDHATAAGARAMEAREVQVLATLRFADPYAPPAVARGVRRPRQGARTA